MARLLISETFGTNHVTREDGARLRHLIEQHWSDEDTLVLDFSGLRIASVSFFDESLGASEPQDTREEALPSHLTVTMSDRIYVERAPLPPRVQSRIRDLAMFPNPEYFRKKNARISTWRTPRVIRCSEVTESQIVLPRGSEPALLNLTRELGVKVVSTDQREGGQPIKATFRGELTALQHQALTAVSGHDRGVLVVPDHAI